MWCFKWREVFPKQNVLVCDSATPLFIVKCHLAVQLVWECEVGGNFGSPGNFESPMCPVNFGSNVSSEFWVSNVSGKFWVPDEFLSFINFSWRQIEEIMWWSLST